jgi:hypothetical protein
MKVTDFFTYINMMAWGYNKDISLPHKHRWFTNRTDELLFIECPDKIILVCAGTHAKLREWVWNLASINIEWLSMGKVHRGFARNVDELLGGLHDEHSLMSLIKQKADEGKAIEIIGHSRGGAIAMLIATKLVYYDIPPESLKVVCCACPKLGNKEFAESFKSLLGARTFVINGSGDIVTFLPPWGNKNGRIFYLDMSKHKIEGYRKHLLEMMQ